MKTLLIGWFDEEGIKKKFDIKDDELYIISDKARRMIYKKNKTPNVYYIDDVNDLDEYKRVIGEIGMKFDKVIMNPPYGKTLPKKIVLEVMNFIDNNGEIVDLQPDSSFVNITEIDKLSTEISKNVINYTKINKKDASKLFGAGFASDLGIFKISKAGRKKNILRYEKLLPIYKKLKTVKSWRASCKIKKRNAKYNLPMQGGNGFYKGMGLDHRGLLKGDPEARLVFKSEQCMNNFLNSLDCWPYKLVYILDDGNAVPAHSPFMDDYTQPWTNERFYKYFNITEEEQKIIEETMAQYETN